MKKQCSVQSSKPGRPLIFTDAISKTICEGVRQGLPVKVAAALVGISSQSVYTWLSRDEPMFEEFGIEYRRAQALARVPVIKHLMAIARGEVHSDRGANAAMFLLARWFPEEYGDRPQTPQMQPVNVAIIAAARESAARKRADPAERAAYHARLLGRGASATGRETEAWSWVPESGETDVSAKAVF